MNNLKFWRENMNDLFYWNKLVLCRPVHPWLALGTIQRRGVIILFPQMPLFRHQRVDCKAHHPSAYIRFSWEIPHRAIGNTFGAAGSPPSFFCVVVIILWCAQLLSHFTSPNFCLTSSHFISSNRNNQLFLQCVSSSFHSWNCSRS